MSTRLITRSDRHDRMRHAAKRVAITIDTVVPSTTGVVVLAYHRVGGHTVSPVDLPASMFRRQMAHLAARADVIGLDSGLEILADPTAIGQRTVLTFDDGTADFLDEALPVLVEFDIPAVLYVASGFVDSGATFPDQGLPLSWSGLRECVSTGLVSVGSHTHNHVLLDRCASHQVDLELERCDARIADELGLAAAHFAYPKAVSGSRYADGAVRRRYRSAAVAGTRANRPGATDPWHLRRSPIQNADGWDGFLAKSNGGMRVEDDLRRLLNTARYRGRAT